MKLRMFHKFMQAETVSPYGMEYVWCAGCMHRLFRMPGGEMHRRQRGSKADEIPAHVT